jgi:hypothetical protein
LLGDPGSKFLCGKLKKDRKKEKEHTRKERKKKIQTAELNRRDQVTAPNSWPSFRRKTGAKVDYQVAAPTVLGTPTMHRAKIAQQRVRMEGWRQRRPGSNARNPLEGKSKQKEKNTLDSYRPSHGRRLATLSKFRSRIPPSHGNGIFGERRTAFVGPDESLRGVGTEEG